ncbi:MAG TPA: aspartate carbamoyltransferase catalytic subunit [Sphingomicrobium sp.]|nr:aspartate carbamoyltransferase catalytic subunit [Sphingomicrobium sp.]
MDLTSIDSLSDDQVETILDEGERWAVSLRDGDGGDDRLRGRVVFNLFYENSTRTLMSFATAAQRLGAGVVRLPVEQSSVKKGETLEDTASTLGAMRPDALVIRHRENGAADRVAAIVRCPVINAGDGTNEHPTQALLDALTIRSHFGRIEGLAVAICGDIRHSRVAHSNSKLLARLGANVRLAGPPELLPDGLPALDSVDEAMEGADVVMMLRVQRERLERELGDQPGEYLRSFGLTAERFARAAPHAMVMHPGPMNRGVEIEDSLADDPKRALIMRQVEYGVAVRMACLDLLISGS